MFWTYTFLPQLLHWNLPPSHNFVFSFSPMKFNLYCPYILGCVAFQLEHGWLTSVNNLKGNWLSSEKLSIARMQTFKAFLFFRSHKLTWIYVAPAVPRFIEIFLPSSAGIIGVYYHEVIHTWFYYSLHSEFSHAFPWLDSFSWIDIVSLCIWPRIYPFFY